MKERLREKLCKSFLHHSGFKRYFANTSWLMAEKILRMAVGLSVGVWVTRYLGPEKFGLISYSMSIVALFSAFATLGLDGIVVRELVKTPEKRDNLLGTAFILKLIGGIFVLSILAIAILSGGADKQTGLFILIIAAGLVFQSFNVVQFYFESKVLAKYFVYAQLITTALASIIRIVLVLIKAPLLFFVIAASIESLFMGICLIAVYKYQKFSILNWKFTCSTALNLLRDSWPLILSGIAIIIYMRIDQIMIKHMLNAEAVGQYAAAVRLSEAWYFIPLIITSSLFPAILNAKKASKELYYQRLQKLYDLMLWLAVAIALPTTFLAPWVIRALYGEAFSPTAGVLSIHVWAGVFVFLGVARGKWLLAENLQKYSFLFVGSAVILNIFLNMILIKNFGIVGAATATLITHMASVIIFPYFIKYTRPSVFQLLNSFNILTLIKSVRSVINRGND